MLNRRDFIKSATILGAGFLGMREAMLLAGNPKSPQTLPLHPAFAQGYGALVPDKNKLLNLPKNFSYKIISKSGDRMTDGFFVSGRPDGMAAFEGETGKVVLVRNHELSNHELRHSPFGVDNRKYSSKLASRMYDTGYGKTPHLGGTTTLVYDEKAQKVVRSFLSLLGTSRNCAGGKTRNGSWLSCEEDYQPINEKNAQKHGYVFEVKASEKPNTNPAKPIRAMGRFNHEAVGMDTRTGIVYLTEDRHEGLFYRFIPTHKHSLHRGGKLQALSFVAKKSMDTRNWTTRNLKTGVAYAVRWITLLEVDTTHDNLRYRGFKLGAACFARGEGIWFDGKSFFFACTNGGKLKAGQIFKYTPSLYEGTTKETNPRHRPTLELFVEPNNFNLLRYADNLTIAPNGDIIFVEDNSSPRIIGITRAGKFYLIAHQVGHDSELAGVCFSPSGKTLFVNVQDAGLTLAITGAWAKTVQ
jgi:secreted PhoX family phosphatase